MSTHILSTISSWQCSSVTSKSFPEQASEVLLSAWWLFAQHPPLAPPRWLVHWRAPHVPYESCEHRRSIQVALPAHPAADSAPVAPSAHQTQPGYLSYTLSLFPNLYHFPKASDSSPFVKPCIYWFAPSLLPSLVHSFVCSFSSYIVNWLIFLEGGCSREWGGQLGPHPW